MPRDYRVYLDDILSAITKIRAYTHGFSFKEFSADSKTVDAVVRNLEIIGAAVKHVPGDVRVQTSAVEWNKIAGLRDILAHEYFGVDLEIIWEVIQHKLDTLEQAVRSVLR